ncbi:MAG: NAD(P)/FAD-dependent oxidoreductase [Candidatus Taylorbacteria bacterium]|nr:NAD(P)/FAD-dependent oxidoreductase [Candidatus Taylorbacteria bacterium]
MIKKIVKKSKISNLESSLYDVVVIGGGPAGLMAAGTAGKGGLVSPKRNREGGCKVLLIEKNEELGKKLLMTGGGRCNITNLEPDKQKFMSNFGKKKDFLYTPFSVFDSEDTVRFFNSLGIKTKVEENFRVFPESDNSLDILESLIRFARNNNVEFKLGAEVAGFDREEYQGQKLGKIKSVLLKNGTMISAKSFILTSGGKSHPFGLKKLVIK